MYGKERSREQGRQGNTKLWWAVGITLGLAAAAAFAAIALGLGAGIVSEVESDMEVISETWNPNVPQNIPSSGLGRVEHTTTRIFRREEGSVSAEIRESEEEVEDEAPSSVVTSPPKKLEENKVQSLFTARQVSNLEASPPRFFSTTPKQETTTTQRVETPRTNPPTQEPTTIRQFSPLPNRQEIPSSNLRQEAPLSNLRQVTAQYKQPARQVTTNRVVPEPVTRRPSPKFEMTPTLATVDNNHLDDQQLSYPTLESIIGNSSSLVSLGLLAVDLLLLRNMQEAAWQDERSLKNKMLQDPEVQALSSLFGPTRETRALSSPSPLQQAVDYVTSSFRAAMSLGKAYRVSRKQDMGPTPLDCIWTLYCRNLDKTADIDGPYGALAKINRLGLKVMMGKVPMGRVLDRLLQEFTNSNNSNKMSGLDCSRLFPRCGLEEAQAIVKATVGESS